ncbi:MULTISPECIES: complex I NDUFA9 subunit family protein [unclassified Herbaspirillum]|uniref:complex I NDUFA9 subunit family protein n=1 Tax=unclassified Herbaspirillum TaxID=2624150 RepID=UPI00114D5C77|nr:MULTISPECIES: complex I NDUFA9 subunit family protein [unclassified Herbaspirillum]MBB5390241.1 NADH dehydrogenase [Herbaspirillum sp. SJZ102]TQK09261.1 NADH dehydrogenase [Herbaspirillum sp. SJZ130]TQK14052.1 NADH dehydrogenase [Herbaspirillum sp. SJZ106]
MAVRKILVIGGSGFIGTRLVRLLGSATDYRVMVPTRRYERAKHLLVSPVVSVVQADIHDDAVLSQLVAEADVVVNLVGILHSRPARRGQPYGPDFERQQVSLPRRIVAACVRHGVPRYLHMSALGADAHGPSMYLRSKAAGEREALAASSLEVAIFRPSVVFGEDDRFLNLFAGLQRRFPVIALGSAEARFQPVYVGDVAQAFRKAIALPHIGGKVYELAGPTQYSLRELVQLAGWYGGHMRPIVALPPALGLLQAWALEHLPGKLMSRDNVASMRVDNVMSGPIAPELELVPTALEDVAPACLAPRDLQRQFDLFRSNARR